MNRFEIAVIKHICDEVFNSQNIAQMTYPSLSSLVFPTSVVKKITATNFFKPKPAQTIQPKI